jgi:Tfp pilus assembly protein PilO
LPVARAVSPRERLLLLAAVAALLAYFGARPLLERAAFLAPRSGKLLADKLNVIAAYRQAVGREGALTAEIAELDSRIGAYDRALLPGATPPLAAADLQTLFKKISDSAGLKIQSEKILPFVKRGGYREIPVQIVAKGDIRNLKEFLFAIDASPVFIAVQDLGLRTVAKRQFVAQTRSYVDSVDIQASMTLVGLIHDEKE